MGRGAAYLLHSVQSSQKWSAGADNLSQIGEGPPSFEALSLSGNFLNAGRYHSF